MLYVAKMSMLTKWMEPYMTFNFSYFLLQTVDVFAIVALSGIVSRLLSTGTVLVATSNRAPEDLNQVTCLCFLMFFKIIWLCLLL